MRKLVGLGFALLVSLAATGCSSSDDDVDGGGSGGSKACDPLAAGTTTVGSVLAAGSDASGTLYIVEQPDSGGENRIFVTSGDQLVRVADVGSGSDGSGQYIFTFTAAGSSTAGDMELLVDASNGTTTMALAPQTDSKDFTPPGDATTLMVVDPSSVEGEAAADLPGEVVFVADIGDGTTLVITAPAEADSYTRYQLFLGTAPTLAERAITTYNAADDGAAEVIFDGPNGSEVANIPCDTVFCSPGSPLGTLGAAGGSATTTLTLREPTPTTLDGLSLLCQ